jgi:hypothetical protein
MQIQTHTCTYIHMHICACIACICKYCMYMRVLCVYVCISMYCMFWLYWLYCVFTYVLPVYHSICLYILKPFYRYMLIQTHTYIHTYNTKKYRYVENVCRYVYAFWVDAYLIHTVCFPYKQIQTCRFPDAIDTGKATKHDIICRILYFYVKCYVKVLTSIFISYLTSQIFYDQRL